MRQGNDTGTQYRSGIYAPTVKRSGARPRRRQTPTSGRSPKAGHGAITTEIAEAPEFYYAEDYHQQYLEKNPDGYCGIGGTGVSCPVGLASGPTVVLVRRHRPAARALTRSAAAPGSRRARPPLRMRRHMANVGTVSAGPRLLVVGCGGIGGIVAAHLREQGHDVTALTTNPLIADAVNEQGFRVRGDGSPGSVRGRGGARALRRRGPVRLRPPGDAAAAGRRGGAPGPARARPGRGDGLLPERPLRGAHRRHRRARSHARRHRGLGSVDGRARGLRPHLVRGLRARPPRRLARLAPRRAGPHPRGRRPDDHLHQPPRRALVQARHQLRDLRPRHGLRRSPRRGHAPPLHPAPRAGDHDRDRGRGPRAGRPPGEGLRHARPGVDRAHRGRPRRRRLAQPRGQARAPRGRGRSVPAAALVDARGDRARPASCDRFPQRRGGHARRHAGHRHAHQRGRPRAGAGHRRRPRQGGGRRRAGLLRAYASAPRAAGRPAGLHGDARRSSRRRPGPPSRCRGRRAPRPPGARRRRRPPAIRRSRPPRPDAIYAARP